MKRYLLNLLSITTILFLLVACNSTEPTGDVPPVQTTPVQTTPAQAIPAQTTQAVADEMEAAITPAEADPLAEPEEAEVFVDIQNIHGIMFDNQGSMFISRKGNEILKVTPDANVTVFTSLDRLRDKTEKTHIWSMTSGKDNTMYVAAYDRIIKVTPDGEMETVIAEEYTGQWGACDVKLDQEGNIYVVHGVRVEKYSGSLQKTTLIDGEIDDIKLSAAVGIDFDKDYNNLYLCDVFGKKVVKYPLDSADTTNAPLIVDLVNKNPEYIAVSENNDAFASLPGGGGVVRVSPDGEKTISCGNTLNEPFTLAFGKKGFDEEALYVVSQGKVYKVQVGCKGAH